MAFIGPEVPPGSFGQIQGAGGGEVVPVTFLIDGCDEQVGTQRVLEFRLAGVWIVLVIQHHGTHHRFAGEVAVPGIAIDEGQQAVT